MSSTVQKFSLAGSFAAAFLASACCFAPVLLSLLGIGGTSFLLRFEAYRTELIAIVFTLLSIAGYFTFREKTKDRCATGSACESYRAKQVNKIVFLATTGLIAFVTFYPTILTWFGE